MESRKREKMLQDRGALPKEEGNLVASTTPCMKKNILSSWLREDLKGIDERSKDMDNKTREEESRSGERRGENGCC